MAEENNSEDGSPVVVQHGGSSLIKCKPVFTNDSKCLVCASGDLIKVYSVISGECVKVLRGHAGTVNALLFDPGNQYHLLSCSDDGKIIKWDFEEGSLIKQYEFGFPLLGLWGGNTKNNLLALRQSSHEKWQLVKFSLPRSSPDRRVEVSVFLERCDSDANHVAVGCKNEFVASIYRKTLWIVKFKKQDKDIRLNHEKDSKFTCVACHPSEETVLTGCKSGKIYIWWNVLGDSVVKTFNHWHALPVLDVAFTTQGSYMLSGGHECVLVKWQYNSHHKDTLPRLGAPLVQISCSKDNTLYATCHAGNVIQIISNNFKVVQIIQGLTRRHLRNEKDIFKTGLLLDPRSHALVTNGRPGHLQFYSLHNDKQLYNLDIVGQNYISPANLEKQVILTELENAALSYDGKWLATVERRDDKITSPEIRLKFWLYDEKLQNYKLNTNVDLPHEQRVCTLKFRNESETSDLMLVSTSSDGKFKLWQLIDDTDIYRKNQRWNCESVGFYQNCKAGPADFSEDGSLLAVGFDCNLTLWDPDTNALRLTLTQRTGVLSHLVFGAGSCSHLLVCASKSAFTVWNMLSCSAEWSLNITITALALDQFTEQMVVFTREKELLVFKPDHNEILHRQSNVSKSEVISAIFIPHQDESTDKSLPWQRHSRLYFLDENQSLMTVKSKGEVKAGIKTQSQKIAENLPQTAFSLLMIQERKRITGSEDPLQQLGNPGAKYLKEMLNTPAHVMPGVNSLCMSFMDTLLIKGDSSKVTAEDESDDEDEEKDMEDDSDADSEMEVDAQVPANTDAEISEVQQIDDRLVKYNDVPVQKLKLCVQQS